MAEYCWKEYRNFVKGLTSLWDEQKGRYVSYYLDGSTYKKTSKNTVQSLFPILVPDIPQKHKDSIISMLTDVAMFILRKNIINLTTLFLQYHVQIQPTTRYSQSISCGEDLPGQLPITSFLKAWGKMVTLTFTNRLRVSGWTVLSRTVFGRCGTHKMEKDMAWRN